MTLRQLFEGLESSGPSGSGWIPPVDIYETPDEVVLVVEAAGVDPASFKVIVDGDVVRIFGSRRTNSETSSARFHRMEIHTGSFTRSFRIRVPFSAEGVVAGTSDGMLSVRLPKAQLSHTIIVDRA